jgi:hypothetical protein
MKPELFRIILFPIIQNVGFVDTLVKLRNGKL